MGISKQLCCICIQSTSAPRNQCWFLLWRPSGACLTQCSGAMLGNRVLQPSLGLCPVKHPRGDVHVARLSPGCLQVISEITLALKALWRVWLTGCDHFWLRVGLKASSDPKSTTSSTARWVCFSPRARPRWLWAGRKLLQQIYWQTLLCIQLVCEERWLKINMQIRSALRIWRKSSCCICIIPAVVFTFIFFFKKKKKKRIRGGRCKYHIYSD